MDRVPAESGSRAVESVLKFCDRIMKLHIKIISVVWMAAIVAGCGSDPGTRQLDEGVDALRSGEYVLAKTWFENSIGETSDADLKRRAYNYLGVACWRLNELSEAVAAFEMAREIEPEHKDAVCNLGLVALETGSNEKAIALIEEAAMLDPDARTLEYLAMAYMRSERWADARRTYLDALELAPKSPRLLTATGLAEYSMERYDAAAELWHDALNVDKKYAPAFFNLAVLKYLVEDDRARGAELIERFQEIAGSDQRRNQIDMLQSIQGGEMDARPDDEQKPSQNLMERARAERKKKGSMAALNLCLQEAINARRRDDEMRQLEALQTATAVCFDQARAHYALGRYYLQRGNAAKATRSLRQALAISPDSTVAQIAFAECSIISENFDAALISLRKALRLDQNNPEALWLLAQLYDEHMEDSSAALETYRRFAELYPGDPRSLEARKIVERLRNEVEQAQANVRQAQTESDAETRAGSGSAEQAAADALRRADAARAAGRWNAAVREYRAALRRQPSSSRTWFNLGVSYGALEQPDQAAEAYRQVLELQPNHISARFNLALIEYQRGDYRAAVRTLETILGKDSSHAKSHFLLGVVYAERLENMGRAKQHYRRFLQLAPNDRNAPAVRSWLQRH